MTRTGKSNTIKIIISAIENLNTKQERKIGQIIFDVNGEYTFSNRQDEGSIYDRFKQRVIRFSTSLKNPNNTQMLEQCSIIFIMMKLWKNLLTCCVMKLHNLIKKQTI